jgi:hypothetical protein
MQVPIKLQVAQPQVRCHECGWPRQLRVAGATNAGAPSSPRYLRLRWESSEARPLSLGPHLCHLDRSAAQWRDPLPARPQEPGCPILSGLYPKGWGIERSSTALLNTAPTFYQPPSSSTPQPAKPITANALHTKSSSQTSSNRVPHSFGALSERVGYRAKLDRSPPHRPNL